MTGFSRRRDHRAFVKCGTLKLIQSAGAIAPSTRIRSGLFVVVMGALGPARPKEERDLHRPQGGRAVPILATFPPIAQAHFAIST